MTIKDYPESLFSQRLAYGIPGKKLGYRKNILLLRVVLVILQSTVVCISKGVSYIVYRMSCFMGIFRHPLIYAVRPSSIVLYGS
jgi:hypothetical protein